MGKHSLCAYSGYSSYSIYSEVLYQAMKDLEFTPELQDRMAANPFADRVIELQAGHLPMLKQACQAWRPITRIAQRAFCRATCTNMTH